MQLQRRGNHRRAFNARSRASVAEHTAKDERVKLHGIFKRQKCTYDIRQTRKSEIQVEKPTLLGRGILCKHSMNE